MIVSDILMPVMDGFTLCREWRKDEQLHSLPFIFYTATYSDPRDEEFALKLGADKFIVKPVDPAVLLDAIEEILSSSATQPPVAAGQLIEDGETYFKSYSEALVRKLEDKLELFRTIFDIDPSPIFMLSMTNTVLELNKAAVTLLGMRAEEILDKNFVETFVPEEHGARFTTSMKSTLTGIEVRQLESVVRSADGAIRAMRWNAQRIMRASGALDGILLIGNDETGQKAAEQERKSLETQLRQAQKMEAIGTFAGGIAHDFNNILTAIMGFIDLAHYAEESGEDTRSSLDSAMLAVEHAKKLVSQMLSISRRGEETFKHIDIAVLIKEAGKLLRASIPHGIDLVLDIDNASGTVHCDPTQIHQVIMNLCTNASQAIGDRNGTISLSCRPLDTTDPLFETAPDMINKPYMVISVSDTGNGIPSDMLDKIYEPYFTTKENGTGLGLPVTRSIVQAHGGTIRVESDDNGTTFRVFLPTVKSTASVPKPAGKGVYETGNNESILLVEDNALSGPMFVAALSSLKYKVTLVADGKDALARFTKNPRAYDVLLSEITIPKMSGLELARQIHALKPRLPILLMSGDAAMPLAELLHSLGIAALLKKPFGIEELSRALKSVCTR